MFERSVDWKKVVVMIGDIVKGTSTVSLRQHSKASNGDDTTSHPVFGWDYRRVQQHGGGGKELPSLVSDSQLTSILSSLTTGSEETFVYEVDRSKSLELDAENLVREFSDITVTVVTLSVGVVHLGWFLVSLSSKRDILHWKMRYHERNATPGQPTAT